jgi:hypothetical protein
MDGVRWKHGDQAQCIAFANGVLMLWWDTNVSGPNDFHVSHERVFPGVQFAHSGTPGTYYVVGFSYSNQFLADGARSSIVGVPFWFLTGTPALMSIWVWRKTRPKQTPAKSFPAESIEPRENLN